MSAHGSKRANKVADALNELGALNLHGGNVGQKLLDQLIGDYFVDDSDNDASEESGSSDVSDDEEVLPPIAEHSDDENNNDNLNPDGDFAGVPPAPGPEHDDGPDSPHPDPPRPVAGGHGVEQAGVHGVEQAGVGPGDEDAELGLHSDDDFDEGPVVANDVNVAMNAVDFVHEDNIVELERIDNFKCECTKRGKNLENKISCSKKLSADSIAKLRMEMAAFTDDERDIVLIAKISSLAILQCSSQDFSQSGDVLNQEDVLNQGMFSTKFL
jgi:hypothetical protein